MGRRTKKMLRNPDSRGFSKNKFSLDKKLDDINNKRGGSEIFTFRE